MNASVTPIRTQAEQRLVTSFAERATSLPGDGWAIKQRADALRRFETVGLPHRRVEEWKWTDLRAFMREALPLASEAEGAAVASLSGLDATRLVFVNGRFAPGLSSDLPDGVTFRTLSSVLTGPNEGDAALVGSLSVLGEAVPLDLNTTFMTDGAVLRVAAGARPAKPLHLAFVFTGAEAAATYARNLIVVEKGAEALIVESVEGPAGIAYQTNIATELFVEDGATARHFRLQDEGVQALHLNTLLASLGAETTLETFSLDIGAAVSRNQIGVVFAGEGSNATLAGTSLLTGRQHADTTLRVDHAVPHCDSRERFKLVLDGSARGVFQGKIIVRPQAQKTDGKMMAQGLFLSDEAEFDGKPELEIFADDVVCGHGCTAGRIDEEQLFYLMARGIPQAEAEALLISAFVTEAIETVTHEGLRDALEARAQRWLSDRKAV